MARLWRFRGPEGTPYSVEGDEPPTEEQMIDAYELALQEEHLQTQTPVQPQDTERGRAVGSAISSVFTGGIRPDMDEATYSNIESTYNARYPDGIEPGASPGSGRVKGLALSQMETPTVPAFLSEEAVRPDPQPQPERPVGPPMPLEMRVPAGAVFSDQEEFTGKGSQYRGGKKTVPHLGYVDPGWATAINESEARKMERVVGQGAGLAKAIGMSIGEVGLALTEQVGAMMPGHALMGGGMSSSEGFTPDATWLNLLREKGQETKLKTLQDIEMRSSEGTGDLLAKDWDNIVVLMEQLSNPDKPIEGEPSVGDSPGRAFPFRIGSNEGKTVLSNAYSRMESAIGPEHLVGDADAFLDNPAKYAANYPLETAMVAASLLLPVAPRAAGALLRMSESIASATSARWGRAAWMIGSDIDFDTVFKTFNDELLGGLGTTSKRNVFREPPPAPTLDKFLNLPKGTKGIALDRRKKSFLKIKDYAKKNGIELKTQADIDDYVPPQRDGVPERKPTGPEPSDPVVAAARSSAALGDTRAPMTSELDEVLKVLEITDEPYAPKTVADKEVYMQARREALEGKDLPEGKDLEHTLRIENSEIAEVAGRLADDLMDSPRPVTPVEVAQLNTAIKHTESMIGRAVDRMALGMDEFFPAAREIMDHNAVVAAYRGQLKKLVGATQLGSSEVGRALRMLRVTIGNLYKPGRLRTRAELNKRAILTQEEGNAIELASDSVTKAKAVLDGKLDEVGIIQREMDNIDTRIDAITEDAPAGWKGEVNSLKKDRKVWEKKRFEVLQEADDAGIKLRDSTARADYLAEDVFIPLKNRMAEALIQSALVLPRSLRATADLSAMLNQAVVGVISRPVSGTLSAIEMVTALGTKKGARRTLYGPRVGGDSFGLYGNTQMKVHQDRINSGLRVLDLPGASGNIIGKYEEYFARTGLEALVNYPVVGKLAQGIMAGLDPFERAYGAMLNGMRFRIYDDMVHHQVALAMLPRIPWMREWFKAPSADQKKRIATLANISTGGGANILEGAPFGSSRLLKKLDKAIKNVGQNVFWSWNQTSSSFRWVTETMPDAISIGAIGFPAVSPAKAGLRAVKAYKGAKTRRSAIQMTMEAIETTGDPKIKARLQKQLDKDMALLKDEYGLDFADSTPGKVAGREAAGQSIILAEYARQVGVYLYLFGSMKDQGFEIDLDIFSSSFGTITADDGYTADMGGGRFQSMRLAVQAITAEKRMSSGKVRDFDEDFMASYADPFLSFGRSKLRPLLGSVTNLAMGKDFIGREVGVFTEMGSNVVPLVAVNALESIFEESGVRRAPENAFLRTAYSILGGRGYYKNDGNYAIAEIRKRLKEDFGIDETEMGMPELRDKVSEALQGINPELILNEEE